MINVNDKKFKWFEKQLISYSSYLKNKMNIHNKKEKDEKNKI